MQRHVQYYRCGPENKSAELWQRLGKTSQRILDDLKKEELVSAATVAGIKLPEKI
jgi:hypothetical protein